MNNPNLIIFATGGKGRTEGGSGFVKLAEASQTGLLEANIVAVVSNNPEGGVFTKAQAFGIRFEYSPKPRTAEDYKRLVSKYGADYVALSGWLGRVEGLDPRITFNIHPAYDLLRFGGQNFYGHKVHEAVHRAYILGEVTHTGVSMHFATAKYDDPGAVFFKRKVQIYPDDSVDSIAKRVNDLEHEWQAKITNRVVRGEISWDGVNPASIRGADIEL